MDSIKLVIAGSRSIKHPGLVEAGVALVRHKTHPVKIGTVVCGGAKGIDEAGYLWGRANSVPVTMFEADWEKLGKRAGFARNHDMALFGTHLLLIWDGTSPGSANMKAQWIDARGPSTLTEIVVK